MKNSLFPASIIFITMKQHILRVKTMLIVWVTNSYGVISQNILKMNASKHSNYF